MRYLIIILLLTSCSANWHLKQSKRHLKIAEQKGAVIMPDTVYVERRVIVPEVKTDTIFHALEGDTVFITKDKLKIKYVRLAGDSVFIEGKCDPDTVKINVPVTITKNISAPCWPKWWLIVAVLATIGVMVLFRNVGR